MQYRLEEDIEYGSQDQLLTYQLNKLNNHLVDLRTRSPYYGPLLDREFHLEDLSDLKLLPFTTKDILAAHNEEFLSVEKRFITDMSTTSGTLGTPVSIYLTRTDIKRLAFNEMRSFQMTGANDLDIFQLLTTMDKRFMAGLAYHYGAQQLGAAMIRMGPGAIPMQWESILRFEPSYLIAVPSFVPQLIDYAEKHNIDYSASSVKKIICIGESIRDHELNPNRTAQSILEKWDIQLFSTYASSEMATAFTECVYGIGGHLLPELMYIEVLDEKDQHVANGQSGEVVATPFDIQGMPLLRFRTGDICTYYNERCSCGRITPRLGPVLGRKQQMLKLKGTSIYPSSISNVLNGIDGIHNYVMIASLNQDAHDQVKILIDTDAGHIESIREILRSQLRVTMDIELKSNDEIDKLKFGGSSRKPRLFIDHRQ